MCISPGDESGSQWEDYVFELQNGVKWRMMVKMERFQMHAMSLLLRTCEGMSDRRTEHSLTKEQTGYCRSSEQEQRDWTAGVKALYSLLASTTFGLAKELVKQRLE